MAYCRKEAAKKKREKERIAAEKAKEREREKEAAKRSSKSKEKSGTYIVHIRFSAAELNQAKLGEFPPPVRGPILMHVFLRNSHHGRFCR